MHRDRRRSNVTFTPGAFAEIAATMFVSPLFSIRPESTLDRALAIFSTSRVVPAPVTTTSPSWSGFASNVKLTSANGAWRTTETVLAL